CGIGLHCVASTEHAVTHVLGNASPFRVYCTALHPHRHLRREQSRRSKLNQENLHRTHSWIGRSYADLESRYSYVQSIGIRCDDVRLTYETLSRRIDRYGTLEWITPETVGLRLPVVLGDLQLCFTEGTGKLLPGEETLGEADERGDPSLLINPNEGG